MRKSSRGNPYHDWRGRFCTAAEACTACVVGEYYDVENMSLEDRKQFVSELNNAKAEQFYKQQNENRENGIKRPRNTEKPQKVETETGMVGHSDKKMSLNEAVEYAKSVGIDVQNLGKADKELMAANIQRLGELARVYPIEHRNGVAFKFSTRSAHKKMVEDEFYQRTGCRGKVKGLMGSNNIACVSPDTVINTSGDRGRMMAFTEAKFKQRQKHIEDEERMQNAKWHSVGDPETQALCHEYGHLVQYDITARKGISPKEMHDRICEGMTPAERVEYSSEYGTKGGYREFFAEAFANAVNGKPNRLGKATLKFLDTIYKE